MAGVKANSPIGYTDNSGAQQQIPLSALSIDSGGTVDPTAWPPFNGYDLSEQQVIRQWLSYLVDNNLLEAIPVAPPKPAMVVRASDPGSHGNDIQVSVASYTVGADPTQTPFVVTVTETDSYCNVTAGSASSSSSSSAVSSSSSALSSASSGSALSSSSSSSSSSSLAPSSSSSSGPSASSASSAPSLSSISSSSSSGCANAPTDVSALLGTDVTPSAKPGLVHVVAGSVDPTRLPAAGTYSFPAPAANTQARVNIPDSGSVTVCTLEAKKPNDKLTKVQISNVDAVARTFSLVATWTNNVTVTTANAAANLKALGYEVTFTGPGGYAFSLPAPGSTTLSGGTDGVTPATASAVIFGRA